MKCRSFGVDGTRQLKMTNVGRIGTRIDKKRKKMYFKIMLEKIATKV